MSTERDVKEILGAEKIDGNNLDRFSGQDTRLDSTVKVEPQDYYSTFQAVLTGLSLQIREFQYPIHVNNKTRFRRSGMNPNRFEEYKERTLHLAKNRLMTLAKANFEGESKFLTLTFRDDPTFDINDLKTCKQKLRLFLRRLRKRYPKVKYIAVAEYQKRGAVHFHMLCDLPRIPKDDLAELWGHGFIDIRGIKANNPNIGGYLAKYLTKQLRKGEQRVITSRHLYRPEKFYGEKAMKLVSLISRLGLEPAFKNQYWTTRNGQVKFYEYNLPKSIKRKQL